MPNHQLCRVGVFYDGSYFMLAQRHLRSAGSGWLEFPRFHQLLEGQVRAREPGFTSTKIVYAAWFQGLHSTSQGDDGHRLHDRNYHHDLLHAGIDAKFLPMCAKTGREKGVDVALAVDAMQAAHDDRVDVAVLVTGDGDMVPLAQALTKRGLRVMVAHFDYKFDEHRHTWANDRLLAASNYVLNINALEAAKETAAQFHALFRKDERSEQPARGSTALPVGSGRGSERAFAAARPAE